MNRQVDRLQPAGVWSVRSARSGRYAPRRMRILATCFHSAALRKSSLTHLNITEIVMYTQTPADLRRRSMIPAHPGRHVSVIPHSNSQ